MGIILKTRENCEFDNAVMKILQILTEDAGLKVPYSFLEGKQNRNKLESKYDTKPQLAVA